MLKLTVVFCNLLIIVIRLKNNIELSSLHLDESLFEFLLIWITPLNHTVMLIKAPLLNLVIFYSYVLASSSNEKKGMASVLWHATSVVVCYKRSGVLRVL